MTVVSDTSVVLNLCFLGQENLLPSLFGTILTPPEVRAEFERLAAADPRFTGLVFPSFVTVASPRRTAPALLHNRRLHLGEIAALSLAVERHADALLLDDRAAREVAAALGITFVGLAGILIQAKLSGHVPAVCPLLDQLETGAKFRLSPAVRQEILRRVSE